jgi:hypothetical protein
MKMRKCSVLIHNFGIQFNITRKVYGKAMIDKELCVLKEIWHRNCS